MRQVKTNRAMVLAAAAMTACAGVAMAADSTWSGTPTDSDWSNSANWTSGVPGTTSGSPANTATFSATSAAGLQVNPDANRRISNITFDASAGNYIIGPASGATPLTITGGIIGNSANTITFNSPIVAVNNSSVTAAANEVFNFDSVYKGASGAWTRLYGPGTINFNQGIGGTTTFLHLSTNNSTAVVNVGAASTTQDFFLSITSGSTFNLKASGIIGGATTGYSSNSAYGRLYVSVDGKLNVNAADAIGGTSPLISTSSSNIAPVVTIDYGQSYTGRSTTAYSGTGNMYKRAVGTGDGTLLGNVTGYDPDGSGTEYLSQSIIGANGYTVAGGTTSANPTLWANNASGSATGNSDVNIVTGTLGGDGYIVNTDVTVSIPAIGGDPAHDQIFTQGVTLHKRQVVTGITNGTNHNDYYSGVTASTLSSYGLTANGAATYGKLSPGASAGAVGTLTMDLGSKGLNIAAAVSDANTQSLLFDLVAPGSSDQVSLLNNTTLHIGSAGLEWDDFAFSTTGSIPAGTYTLFASQNNVIDGTLGSNVSGMLDGTNFHLALANGGKDLVLTSVPEPATLGLLAIGGLGLLARRRRTA